MGYCYILLYNLYVGSLLNILNIFITSINIIHFLTHLLASPDFDEILHFFRDKAWIEPIRFGTWSECVWHLLHSTASGSFCCQGRTAGLGQHSDGQWQKDHAQQQRHGGKLKPTPDSKASLTLSKQLVWITPPTRSSRLAPSQSNQSTNRSSHLKGLTWSWFRKVLRRQTWTEIHMTYMTLPTSNMPPSLLILLHLLFFRSPEPLQSFPKKVFFPFFQVLHPWSSILWYCYKRFRLGVSTQKILKISKFPKIQSKCKQHALINGMHIMNAIPARHQPWFNSKISYSPHSNKWK